MTKYDGRLSHIKHVAHSFLGNMANIHKHPQTVHLRHDLPPKIGQAVMLRGYGRRVRPRGIAGVREGHVARAQLVEHAQSSERGVDLVAAFDTDKRPHATAIKGSPNVAGGQGEAKDVRVLVHHLVHHIDLLHGGTDCVLVLHVAGNVYAPELAPEFTLPNAWNVGIKFRRLVHPQVDGGILEHPVLHKRAVLVGKIIMSVR
mmetsp:Transcript_30395/g.85054  ORF Transcript_30395/g.85054 Transcript_30395/m.85054 type:complete len:202 (-) Transcript_30395:314-919(-)